MVMIAGQYLLGIALVVTGSFGWPLLLVLANLPKLPELHQVFQHPKPATRPEGYPAEAWPLWFSAFAFRHTRHFTSLFLLGVVLDTLLL